MRNIKNIIITGSNKSIGFGIVQNLASKPGWNIIMAVRNLQLGKKAQEEINQKHNHSTVQVQKLDIQNNQSVAQFTQLIKQKYGTIDVLVNNAGIAAKDDAFNGQVAKSILQTNFYGTIHLTEQMLPLLQTSGKLVTIGSTTATTTFKKLPNQLKQRFTKENLTKVQLYELMQQFKDRVEDNTYAQKGWPKSCYGVSKLGISLYQKILCQYQQVHKRMIQVYYCCPGYVKTDMTSHRGRFTIEQGIKTPIYLIELPFQLNKQNQGGFFYLQKKKEILQ